MDAFQMARALEAFAKRSGFVPPPAFYIVGEFNLRSADGASAYSDEAHLWCQPCAESLLASAHALMPEDQRADHFVCQTDADYEDTCPHCRACGETLDGGVSSYAVAEEVAHYADNPILPGEQVNARQAVEIAQILSAAPADPDVLAIGKAALTAISAQEQSA